ncbi:transporter substrate-binding domain-containing protein [Arthrobacter sp. ISL-95]|uniref:transporter substrate-binding domain-containing protein n=1 Tax=Arthrobacter sp. ISL-95 TaxID=2819116 RepID=UPI002570CD23|nr:transporter substrate-binding domain-containing protein [Arthrobacter sp. ISL-95]
MKNLSAPQQTKRALPAIVVTAALMLAVTACSPSGNASTSNPSGDAAAANTGVPALEVNQAAVDLLPESVKASKVLRVAIPTNEPPTQFYREGTQEMTGTNPDVARLIGEALGVKVDIQVANFDSIIPGLAANRYDMTVSSMTPTEKRMEVLDFVDYMQISIEEQTIQAMKNLGEVLGAHGLDFSHVVKATVHLHHPGRDFDGFNAIYEKYVVAPYPARTTVGSFLGDFRVEIDIVAVIP